MPIEKKTGLFYELLIRGRWDAARGALGEVETYQLQTGTAVVDTDVTPNVVISYQPDPATDLTKEQVTAFLDDKFSGFIDQLSNERAQHAAALADMQKQRDDAIQEATANDPVA